MPLGERDVFLNRPKRAWSENQVQAQAGSWAQGPCPPRNSLSGVYVLLMKLGHLTHAAGFRPKIRRRRNFLSSLLPGALSLTWRGAAFQRLESLLPAPPCLTKLWLWSLDMSSSYQRLSPGPAQAFSPHLWSPLSVLDKMATQGTFGDSEA